MTPSEALQILLALSLALVVLAGPAEAQQHKILASFGPYVDRLLDYQPIALCVTAGPGEVRPVIAVLSPDHPIIRFYRLDDRARVVDAGSFDLPSPQEALVAADFDGKGTTDYAALSRRGNEVTIIRGHGDTFTATTVSLHVSAMRIAVADINNDGVQDLLLFGKSMTGVATLLGRKDGSFATGPLLFPEISVSDLKTADLNGDGITDVVLLNWLSNELMIYYGISRAIFSEQVTIQLPGEPADLAIGPVSGRRIFRAAVTLPQQHQAVLVTADPAGEMEVDGTVDLPGVPHGIQLTPVNADPWPDLVSSTDRGMVVAMGSEQGEFGPVTLFGPGAGSVSWTVVDIDGDRQPDLVCADEEGWLKILGNANRRGRVVWPDVYAVGLSPAGITVRDFDNDGRPDICVANSASSTVTFLFNRGDGRMSGEVSAVVPDHPASVTSATRGDLRTGTVITTHPAGEKLGVLTVSKDMMRTELFAIPTGADPSVVFAREDTSKGLVILVRTTDVRSGSLSMSLFEQLGSGQFLERSLRTNLPQRILALTVDDFTGQRSYDLAYVTNDRATKMSTVALASGTPEFDFTSTHRLFLYPDSLGSTRLVLAGRMDNDAFADLLLVIGRPRNAMAIAYGRGDGTFRDTVEWIPNVRPMRDDEIVIRDVNRDGFNDIVFLDGERNAVVALFGRGDGRFSAPQEVVPGDNVTGLAVSPLRPSGGYDLILSYGRRGTIKIVYGAFELVDR